jgi:hypothetical protein
MDTLVFAGIDALLGHASSIDDGNEDAFDFSRRRSPTKERLASCA